jgi:hypothetical protein
MSIDELASEALRLPPDQRALLAASLWESLEDPYQAPGNFTDADAITLAVERDRQIDAGEIKPISHEELMRRIGR